MKLNNAITVAVMIAATLTAGCTNMSTNPMDRVINQTAANEWPVKYYVHSFGAYCYNTIGCQVEYADTYQIHREPGEVSPAMGAHGEDASKVWEGTHSGISNFPRPATVRWQSRDGVAHEERIDIGEIFKDGVIRTKVPRDQVAEDVHISDPDIILVVDDRTVNVYMKTRVPLKKPEIPGNDLTRGRDELILAYKKTF